MIFEGTNCTGIYFTTKHFYKVNRMIYKLTEAERRIYVSVN